MFENVPLKEVAMFAVLFGLVHIFVRGIFVKRFTFYYGDSYPAGGKWRFLPNKIDLLLTFFMWVAVVLIVGVIYFEKEWHLGIDTVLVLSGIIFLAARLFMDTLPYRRIVGIFPATSLFVFFSDAFLGGESIYLLFGIIERDSLETYNIAELFLALGVIIFSEYLSFSSWIFSRYEKIP